MLHPFHHARTTPDKPAVVMAESGETVTYRQLEDGANRVAQLFRKLGLNPQQTAVLEGDNEQQQRLEQALLTPDTEEYYNAAAL